MFGTLSQMMHLFDTITLETTPSTPISATPKTHKANNNNTSSSTSVQSSNGSMTANLVDLGKKLLDASRNGLTEHVRNLTQSGAPFTTDYLGTSALHFAAQNGHTDSAEILLRAGVSKDARTKLDRTALHVAAQEGHLAMVELLLSNGADANARDMLKMTPLHWAVERGHMTIVDRLLNSGADVTAMSKFFITPVEIAEELQYYEILDLLKRYMSNVDINDLGRETAARLNQMNSSESRPYIESNNAQQRKRNKGTKGSQSYTNIKKSNNISSTKPHVVNSGNTNSANFYSQMIRPLIEPNSDILSNGVRFDGNKRRVLITNISTSNPSKVNLSDMSSSLVDKQTADWLKSAFTTSVPDLGVVQRLQASPSGTNSNDIDNSNFNPNDDDFNPLDLIGDGVNDLDFDDDEDHPILNAYHNFNYPEDCLNSQSDLDACAQDGEIANSETSIFYSSKLESENSLDHCLDLADSAKQAMKIDLTKLDQFLKPTTAQSQTNTTAVRDDVSQKFERLKKVVEELQKENSHLRQRVEELTASGSQINIFPHQEAIKKETATCNELSEIELKIMPYDC